MPDVTVFIRTDVARITLQRMEDRPGLAIDDPDITSAVPCSLSGPWSYRWLPQFQNPDVHESATFDCGGERLSVFVSGYASALQGAELISSSNHIVPQEWDRFSSHSTNRASGSRGQSHSVGEVLIDSPTGRAIIWYWYEVDGRISPSPLITKFNQVFALVRRRPAGGRVIVIETSNNTDIESARARLESVVTSVMGSSAR